MCILAFKGGPALLNFRPKICASNNYADIDTTNDNNSNPSFAVLLQPNSLVVFRGKYWSGLPHDRRAPHILSHDNILN